jgi:hypothetical protein
MHNERLIAMSKTHTYTRWVMSKSHADYMQSAQIRNNLFLFHYVIVKSAILLHIDILKIILYV